MEPVTEEIVLQRPREEVFGFLADVANARRFLDHVLTDWHLTREDSIGRGAGVRFKVKLLGNRFAYYDATLLEVEPPYRLAYVGRGGKYDRTQLLGEITLTDEHGGTRLRWTVETAPGLASDGLMETLTMQRGLAKRGLKRGLSRLRGILEDGDAGSARVSMAGGARKPASGFRLDPRLADTPEGAGTTSPSPAHAGRGPVE
ncbi:SRPBCC family protein [Patulibacter americanus]|uniref:SRPBCC family protein n=1 Tax=Patulibacter americanus TaxID=588672 RepID=UPI0003B3807E|nr:SRPBCC family protein [Patulibacter americanus]